jgi:hypothetical protein
MGSSPGFVSNPCDLRPLQTRFRSGCGCSCLNLPQRLTRRLILQKARGQACPRRDIALPPIVSARFQVLFHSPNRGSFHLSLTVLVRYRSSRVFSLGEWSPLLPTGLACPVVLRISAGAFWLSSTGLSPSLAWLSRSVRLAVRLPLCGSSNPGQLAGRFGLLPFRSPLLGKSSLFLGVLRCFSSPRSPRPGYVFTWRYAGFPPRGFPHSDIPGCSRLHTAHRGFSQCTTSFVGS